MRQGSFKGRRVLVTGGAAGIGAAIARAVVARDGRVAILDIDGDGAAALARELGEGAALACQGDVTEPAAVEAALDAMTADWGGLDGLVNNAGLSGNEALLDVDEATWQRVIEVNLTAPHRVAGAAVERLGPGGSIVNVASIYGVVAAPDRGPYCVAKAGLVMLTRVQALEWASRGIRVNAVAPGYIETPETQRLAAAGTLDLKAVRRRTPLGRLGTPDDVAAAVCFLLDPIDAAYLTGHVLGVDGGWTAYGYV